MNHTPTECTGRWNSMADEFRVGPWTFTATNCMGCQHWLVMPGKEVTAAFPAQPWDITHAATRDEMRAEVTNRLHALVVNRDDFDPSQDPDHPMYTHREEHDMEDRTTSRARQIREELTDRSGTLTVRLSGNVNGSNSSLFTTRLADLLAEFEDVASLEATLAFTSQNSYSGTQPF